MLSLEHGRLTGDRDGMWHNGLTGVSTALSLQLKRGPPSWVETVICRITAAFPGGGKTVSLLFYATCIFSLARQNARERQHVYLRAAKRAV